VLLNFGKIMKNISLLVTASAILSLNLPAFAAQDQSNVANPATQESQKSTVAANVKKPTLLLDHGPRAVVTPWVNQQRILSAQEQGR